jgi:oxygen-independent coproporphyrinogen III oxidase
MDDMVDAIVSELELRQNYLQIPAELNSVYFGGGTPSLLKAVHLDKIFNAINKFFRLSVDVEITIEANPDDLSVEHLTSLTMFPVNRLSIGVQSFFDDDLKFMNRAHNSSMAIESVLHAADRGFSNITIDLIYGLPEMSNDKWKQNLSTAFSLPVHHISCYALTVEKKTALDKLITEGKVQQTDDALVSSHFEILLKETAVAGFEQYEISNFAKGQRYSRHNCSYWNGEHYIGLGPSAHSFNGISRQWNISSNGGYIQNIKKGALPFTIEQLTTENKYNEYILTRLRTKWGVNSGYIEDNFGNYFKETFIKAVGQYSDKNFIIISNNNYVLTDTGKLIADRITESLFVIPQQSE